MEESDGEANEAVPRVVIALAATAGGTLTLVWIAFLVWLVLKALSLM